MRYTCRNSFCWSYRLANDPHQQIVQQFNLILPDGRLDVVVANPAVIGQEDISTARADT